jgi:hypothetical protein
MAIQVIQAQQSTWSSLPPTLNQTFTLQPLATPRSSLPLPLTPTSKLYHSPCVPSTQPLADLLASNEVMTFTGITRGTLLGRWQWQARARLSFLPLRHPSTNHVLRPIDGTHGFLAYLLPTTWTRCGEGCWSCHQYRRV